MRYISEGKFPAPLAGARTPPIERLDNLHHWDLTVTSYLFPSEEIRKRDIRIAQDRSLMIEGRHIGGDADQHEPKPADKPTGNEENEKKKKERKKEVEPPVDTLMNDKDKKG